MATLKSDMGFERTRLQQDNGRLNDLVSEMRLRSKAEVESFRAEIERMAIEAEEELESAHDKYKGVCRERDEISQVSVANERS
jgi:hypothetical protein